MSNTQATIEFTTDKEGTAYYLVKESGVTAPSNVDVKNGTSLGTVSAGKVSEKSVTLTSGAKDIYVVVESAANTLSQILKISVGAGTVNIYVNDAVPYTTLPDVKTAIETALASGDVVVTGWAVATISNYEFKLDIPVGKTVVWKADYSTLMRLNGDMIGIRVRNLRSRRRWFNYTATHIRVPMYRR